MIFRLCLTIYQAITFGALLERVASNLAMTLDKLPDVAGKITIALITVLIPLTIAVLQDFFVKGREKLPFAKLDLLVILDYVVRIKYLLLYASTPYIAEFLWPILSFRLRILVSLAILLGMYQVVRTIFRLYDWSKDNRYKYRFSYLKISSNSTDLLTAWESVWTADIKDFRLEQEYFKIFSQFVTERLYSPGDKSEIDVRLLESFKRHIDQRSMWFIEIGDATKQILEWHHYSYTEAAKRRSADVNEWARYNYPERLTEEILHTMVARTVQSTNLNTGYVLETISKYVADHESEVPYLQSVARSITHLVLEELDKLQVTSTLTVNDKLESFPNNWLITSSGITSHNAYVHAVLSELLRWLFNRVDHAQSGFDRVGEAVVHKMFPNAEPIIFSKLFYFGALGPDYRSVAEIIRTPQTFGLTGRIFTGESEDIDKLYRNSMNLQTEEAFKLIRLIFSPPIYSPEVFANENIKKYLIDLEKIKPTDDREQDLIESWQSIFNYMLKQNKDH